MRKKYSIINATSGIVTKIGSLILGFICRTIFINELGYEHLGINGLFSNILTLLSLSELGFGSSIIYLLYKAEAENDIYKKNCLLTFYAKIYNIIGCFIILMGIALTPILQWLIKDNNFDIEYLRKVFILQILNSAISYFFSYRSSLIFVNQKDYILKLVSFGSNLGCNLIQIIALRYHTSYYLYLIIQLLFTFVNNMIIYILSKKMYPEIKIGKSYQLDKETFKEIRSKVSALLCHNISGFVTNGTDNIIISKLIGIIEVGLYSNYNMVVSGILGMLDAAMKGVTASLGNFMAKASTEEVYKVYKKIDFIFYSINALCTTCLCVLLRKFIILWIGQESIFPRFVEIILVANFYISVQRKAIFTVRNVGGLFSNDKNAALVKPIINLIISVFLAYSVGISGVFIGTLVSGIIVDVLWMPYMVYKRYFQRNFIEYVFEYFKQCGIIALSIAGTEIVCRLFDKNSLCISQLFLESIMCCFITIFDISLFYNNYIKTYIADIKRFVKKGK